MCLLNRDLSFESAIRILIFSKLTTCSKRSSCICIYVFYNISLAFTFNKIFLCVLVCDLEDRFHKIFFMNDFIFDKIN